MLKMRWEIGRFMCLFFFPNLQANFPPITTSFLFSYMYFLIFSKSFVLKVVIGKTALFSSH